MKKKNTKYVVIPLLLLLLLVTVGGTVAWLTHTDERINSFTVGSFNLPSTDPVTHNAKNLTQFLDEPSWSTAASHKLIPGITYAKDPYVGIGEGSEDAVVYVYVDNHFSDKVYFTINNGWTAVSGETKAAATGAPANSYTSGLFKYTAGLTNAASADVWTATPLFSEIVVADDAVDADFTPANNGTRDIVVKSFIHQAKDGEGQAISEDEVILPAAKTALGVPANNNG